MPTMTLLSMVQNILSDMDSDNVNSINDTIEAQQIASIIETSYNEIVGSRYWPHLAKLKQLTASGTTARPTHMGIPSNVQRVEWIKYDKALSTDTRVRYSDVKYLNPKEFLDLIMERNQDDTDVDKITDPSGTPLLIKNNKAPEYWTSFDDETLVFDSYDNSVDTTLQASKTQVQVYEDATWSLTDTFVPDLPPKAFPYLLAESKSTAFASIKQAPNAKEEQKSRRQRTFLAREKWRQNGSPRQPNYGRK